ncbi:MAG: tRNA-dihydrouridine synthase A [Candidatus Azotimanducaceae bacterium]|jgi:tRNA-dihydrouridine synthase A|tara:strand:+ start:22822 stop:23784 length:963 start_codon:yes stop_codon:yes gene_type:complete
MMAWTDKHCRFLHRQYAPSALLFTEMVTTGALLYGKQTHLLDHDHCEHPVALQLGGNDPAALAECAAMAEERGFDEVNINVGCPSDRVQKGTFGACLMREPELVAECVKAMQAQCSIPITVKCRTGIQVKGDNNEFATMDFLQNFIAHIVDAGCQRVYLHARVAVLGGLSPAQNREIPPLTMDKAKSIKTQYPALELVVNGGITDLEQAEELLGWADGIMIGRAAYHNPRFLSQLEEKIYNPNFTYSEEDILDSYQRYAEVFLQNGDRLHSLTKHLLHCFNGRPGARRFRQILSDQSRLKDNDISLIAEAYDQVSKTKQN